jgi:hypothetical protein
LESHSKHVIQSILAFSRGISVENNGKKLQNNEPRMRWDQNEKRVWNKGIHNLDNVPRPIPDQCTIVNKRDM